MRVIPTTDLKAQLYILQTRADSQAKSLERLSHDYGDPKVYVATRRFLANMARRSRRAAIRAQEGVDAFNAGERTRAVRILRMVKIRLVRIDIALEGMPIFTVDRAVKHNDHITFPLPKELADYLCECGEMVPLVGRPRTYPLT